MDKKRKIVVSMAPLWEDGYVIWGVPFGNDASRRVNVRKVKAKVGRRATKRENKYTGRYNFQQARGYKNGPSYPSRHSMGSGPLT